MTTEQRTVLHQMPMDVMRELWKGLDASDWNGHPKCGFVPSGESCHSCGKRLGDPLPFPYSYQDEALEDDHMTCLIAGGEQVGKSTISSMKFLRCVLGFLGEYQSSGRAAGEVAWLVANSYELTSVEFQSLETWIARTPFKIKASSRVDPGFIEIEVKGGVFTIKTRTANDAQTLRAESPIAVLCCEASTMTLDAYTRIRSRVGRSRALFPGYGAIFLASTFEGSLGWYPSLWKRWRQKSAQERENAASFSLPSFSNVFVYKGGEQDPEIQAMKAELGPDEYSERVLAVPAPPSGRVHQSFDASVHIYPEEVPYDPEAPVYIGIDPGYSGQPSTYAVEVFQRRMLPCGRKHYWGIDEIFEWKMTTDNICEVAMQRWWWKNPLKHGVIDIAATQKTAQREESNAEIWRKHTGLVLFNEFINILPGIRRMDSMLNICPDPSCKEPVLALSQRQVGLIAELGGGPHPHDGQTHVYQWPLMRDGSVGSKVPQDRYNDATKASTYLFINLLGFTNISPNSAKIKTKRRELSHAR